MSEDSRTILSYLKDPKSRYGAHTWQSVNGEVKVQWLPDEGRGWIDIENPKGVKGASGFRQLMRRVLPKLDSLSEIPAKWEWNPDDAKKGGIYEYLGPKMKGSFKPNPNMPNKASIWDTRPKLGGQVMKINKNTPSNVVKSRLEARQKAVSQWLSSDKADLKGINKYTLIQNGKEIPLTVRPSKKGGLDRTKDLKWNINQTKSQTTATRTSSQIARKVAVDKAKLKLDEFTEAVTEEFNKRGITEFDGLSAKDLANTKYKEFKSLLNAKKKSIKNINKQFGNTTLGHVVSPFQEGMEVPENWFAELGKSTDTDAGNYANRAITRDSKALKELGLDKSRSRYIKDFIFNPPTSSKTHQAVADTLKATSPFRKGLKFAKPALKWGLSALPVAGAALDATVFGSDVHAATRDPSIKNIRKAIGSGAILADQFTPFGVAGQVVNQIVTSEGRPDAKQKEDLPFRGLPASINQL